MNRRRINWHRWDRLLGTMSDYALARRMGICHTTVHRRRLALSIPAYSGPIDRRSGSIDWSRWDRLLGTRTDRAIADAIGCTPVAVHYRRRKLGIPAYGGSK